MNRASEICGTQSRIWIMERKGKKGRKRILRNYDHRLPKFYEKYLHIQESQQTPGRINVKRFTPRHIIVTLLKDREKS